MTLVSYNCKHFKDRGPKFDFMCDIVNEWDIVFLQEHCLYTSELLNSYETTRQYLGATELNTAGRRAKI